MKIVLGLLIAVAVAGGALVAGARYLPTDYHFEKTVTISSPPDRVFPYLTNLEKWQTWSLWTREEDPTMVNIYSGPVWGIGSQREWDSRSKGKGRQIITDSQAERLLCYDMFFADDERQLGQGSFTLTRVKGGTRVTWTDTGTLSSNLIDKYQWLLQREKTEADLEKALGNLKAMLEEQHAPRQQDAVSVR